MTEKEKTKEGQGDQITLSTGVVIRVKPVPFKVLMIASNMHPKPKVPEVYYPDLGRTTFNPEDPDYIESHKEWEMLRSEAMTNQMVVYGTEFVSSPKGVSKPKDDDWVRKAASAGLDMPPADKRDEEWRYAMWMFTVAMVTGEDFEKVMEGVGRLSGVAEADVKAAGNFPRSD